MIVINKKDNSRIDQLMPGLRTGTNCVHFLALTNRNKIDEVQFGTTSRGYIEKIEVG